MKRGIRTILAAMLCLALAVSLGGCGEKEEAVTTDGQQTAVAEISESFGGGSGTEEDPYQIATADQLRRMAELSNARDFNNPYSEACYLLTADIDLGGEEQPWTPIGGNGNSNEERGAFRGSFDGGGHTVSNMCIEYDSENADEQITNFGLFGYVHGGTIRNLVLASSGISVVSDQSPATGGVVGSASGSVVEDCRVLSDVTVTGAYKTGGVVGDASSGSSVSRCSSAAAVTEACSVGEAGGVVGCAYCGISDCVNTGAVKSAGAAGGVVGVLCGDISGCENSGEVTADKEAGGIVGNLSPNTIGTAFQVPDVGLSDCKNSGSVNGVETAGGAVGVAANGGSGTVSVMSFENSGAITSGSAAAGVVGEYRSLYNDGAKLLVSDCGNLGAVSAADAETSGYFGGIMAVANASCGSVTFTRCKNSADVGNSGGVSGGILGSYLTGVTGSPEHSVDVTFSDCGNEGDVSGGGIGVGGIAGAIESSAASSGVTLTAESCTNTGDLFSAGAMSRIGGIVGVLEPAGAGASVSDCRNTGTITPEYNFIPENERMFDYSVALGGIIGHVGENGYNPGDEITAEIGENASDITISGCVNEGEIITYGDGQIYLTGDIVGNAETEVNISD